MLNSSKQMSGGDDVVFSAAAASEHNNGHATCTSRHSGSKPILHEALSMDDIIQDKTTNFTASSSNVFKWTTFLLLGGMSTSLGYMETLVINYRLHVLFELECIILSTNSNESREKDNTWPIG
mmetsp:Transcript_26186/g.52697  ORF Transcript_26186/g.52697 Transcript_26186/m.52697 type:complete len:123 (-) Transcript_26186:2426-2794(-)